MAGMGGIRIRYHVFIDVFVSALRRVNELGVAFILCPGAISLVRAHLNANKIRERFKIAGDK